MAQVLINVGTTPNDGTGDGIQLAGSKINDNFEELYAKPSVLSDIRFFGNKLVTQLSNADIVFEMFITKFFDSDFFSEDGMFCNFMAKPEIEVFMNTFNYEM